MPNPWDKIVGTKEYNKNYERLIKIARQRGYIFNKKISRVKKVIGLMTMNYLEYGKYYCPCKQSEPPDLEKDVLCPCPTMDDEVKKDGHCFCELFFQKGGKNG